MKINLLVNKNGALPAIFFKTINNPCNLDDIKRLASGNKTYLIRFIS